MTEQAATGKEPAKPGPWEDDKTGKPAPKPGAKPDPWEDDKPATSDPWEDGKAG